VYPQIENHLCDDFCPECHLLTCACLCGKVPRIKTEALFFLLVHSREVSKGSNTGHLLLNALINCEYDIWSRVEPPKKLMLYLKNQNHQPYLVFSADENQSILASAHDLLEGQVKINTTRPLYILIDATWQQARKMVRQSPYLKALPRISLKGIQKSHYRLRRNQQAGGMSTCEAAINLLQEACELDNASALQTYFQAFMQHYEASMSGHGVR